MLEKPGLKMEINNNTSLFTLFISLFFLSLSLLDYCMSVLENQTLKSSDRINIALSRWKKTPYKHLGKSVKISRCKPNSVEANWIYGR